ncbi:MAG TPA: hypothetical protein VK674_06985 [Candidatus Limnocylindria bacterium]|nr:hypothetical protein [Candidatus Limnocylindria bacterium]
MGIRRSVEAVGLTAALVFGGVAACGDDDKDSSAIRSGDTVEVLREVSIHAFPNGIHDPTVGTLAIGDTVKVECYFRSASLAMDSVKVERDDKEGFAFIGQPDIGTGDYTPNFGPDLLGVTSLRACVQGKDFTVQG